MNLVHMAGVMLINELASNFWFTSVNAIVLVISDRRIAGMHITLLTSMTNYAQFIHKFYIFKLVDAYGLFIPQFILLTFALICCGIMHQSFCDLDQVPYSDWKVSNEVIRKNAKTKKVQSDDKDKDN